MVAAPVERLLDSALRHIGFDGNDLLRLVPRANFAILEWDARLRDSSWERARLNFSRAHERVDGGAQTLELSCATLYR